MSTWRAFQAELEREPTGGCGPLFIPLLLCR